MDLINLENNKFHPLRALTETEADYIIEGIKGIIQTSEIDLNYDSVIEYKEGIALIEDGISYEINGSTIIFALKDEIKNLEKDDIFVLPNQTPYKVTNVRIEDDKLIVETTEPSIEETLEYVDVQGDAAVDMSAFIPAEGVEVVQDDIEIRSLTVNDEGSISTPGKINLSIDKKIGDYKISGALNIAMPKISYKADINVGLSGVDINDVYLKFQNKIDVTAQLSNTFLENKSDRKYGYIELGKVPIAGVPGVAILAEFGLDFTIEGKIMLVVKTNFESGVQILNNRFRSIHSLDKIDYDFKVDATAKLGPKVYGLLQICNLWDLIDISASVGLAGSATTQIRNTGMLCTDLTIYLYLDLSALEKKSAIKKWTGATKYSCMILTKDNSPIKKNWHLENFEGVPECTYGSESINKGNINGTVAEAGNRRKFIKDASIKVYNLSNSLIKEVRSDVNGKYNLELEAGTYYLVISKDGYISFESVEVLAENEEKYVQTYLMVGQGYEGEEGIAGGEITNAVTGEAISDITINIRKGWNNLTGSVVKTTSTDEYGKFEVEMPLGNYTVEMIKEGYLTNSYNIYVASGSTLNQNSTLLPNESEMSIADLRIVLTWGEEPMDLDSHLLGPTADGSDYFHIYYSNKVYYDDETRYADLDLDDVTSYGPETTTVYNMNNSGKYSFYVHDYTNRYDSLSTELSNSGAKVEVYKENALLATYNIPTNISGVYWHVFDYDAATNRIIPVNEFADYIRYEEEDYKGLIIPKWEIEEKYAS
ncbi:carboxypeptidase regulatory-like domain-containing protein [Clostridium isatidis]|uniref:carboxypeptidase regulatory-like domain-containing protein n=1 Tax=Clostridium isatidis TaxID=182773 RepID=UPI003AAE8B0C